MTTRVETTDRVAIQRPRAEAAARTGRRPSGLRFDWLVIALFTWLLAGVYLDGWAHLHIPQLETFFTPWHAVFYSGFLALAGVLGGTLVRNRRAGSPWAHALPDGYRLSLLGVFLFAGSGLADMLWHEILGVEADLEALFSPSHLGLAVGAALIGTGPLRAAWRRSDADPRRWSIQLPVIVSLAYLLSLVTFMTQYAHPFGRTFPVWANRPEPSVLRLPGYDYRLTEIIEQLGVFGLLLYAALLVGFVLLALRRWPLRPGALTILLTVNTSLTVFMRDRMVPPSPYLLIAVAVVAGVAIDLLLWRVAPSLARPRALRGFAFALPTTLYAVYFGALAATAGVWWSAPMWTGSIVLAGITGWLLSYLVAPPPSPAPLSDLAPREVLDGDSQRRHAIHRG